MCIKLVYVYKLINIVNLMNSNIKNNLKFDVVISNVTWNSIIGYVDFDLQILFLLP